jgi:hypothetical protein
MDILILLLISKYNYLIILSITYYLYCFKDSFFSFLKIKIFLKEFFNIFKNNIIYFFTSFILMKYFSPYIKYYNSIKKGKNILFQMLPVLSIYDLKDQFLGLKKKILFDKIRLLLTGSLIKNPEILCRKKFNLEKAKILKGCGIDFYQRIRQQNPRLAKSCFFKTICFYL